MTHEAYRPHRQVPPEHYWSRAYNTKERTCSYWHQVDEVLGLNAETVLEVGPGAGIVTDWLRRAGLEVTTIDMDPDLGADLQGSVTDIPLEACSFDAALCCQVLEHLPFPEAERALAELARVTRIGAVVSVPDSTPWVGKAYPLYFPGWYLDELRARVPASRLTLLRDLLARRVRLRDWLFLRLVPPTWSLGGRTLELRRPPIPSGAWRPDPASQHFWEVGAEGTPLERLLNAAEAAGFAVQRTYRVPENPWHRFLVLRLPSGR